MKRIGISKAHLHPGPCPVQVKEGTQGFAIAGWGPPSAVSIAMGALGEESGQAVGGL